jgi:hypothetical protein
MKEVAENHRETQPKEKNQCGFPGEGEEAKDSISR